MNTFVISSKNLKIASDYAIDLSEKEKVNKFDITIVEVEKALGIPDVRELQQKIFLRPFKGAKKAIIIVLPNGATIDAQNSMLKLLEEPPANSLIFLVISNPLSLIPTVLSRVKLIELKEVRDVVNGGLGEIENSNPLVLAQNLSKDKEEAISWLEQTILESRNKMIETLDQAHESLKYQRLIKQLELAYRDLKNTNTNVRLTLENLFLNA